VCTSHLKDIKISAFWRAFSKIPKNVHIYIYEEDDVKRRKREKSRKSGEVECMQTHGRVIRARVHRRVKIIENVGYYLTPI